MGGLAVPAKLEQVAWVNAPLFTATLNIDIFYKSIVFLIRLLLIFVKNHDILYLYSILEEEYLLCGLVNNAVHPLRGTYAPTAAWIILP